MPRKEDEINTQAGVKGPVPLQAWVVEQRHGYVVTRLDENGQRIVLWRDIENMFANNIPKYAKRKGNNPFLPEYFSIPSETYPIPFHVYRDLSEKIPRRISYYENETIQIVLRSLDPNPSQGHIVRHELSAPDFSYFLYVALLCFIILQLRQFFSKTSSDKKRD